MSRFESLRSNNTGAPIKKMHSMESVPVTRKQSAFRSRDKDSSRGGGDYSSFRKKENNFQKHYSHDGVYKPGFASKNPAPANNELNFPTLGSTVAKPAKTDVKPFTATATEVKAVTTTEVKPPKLTYVGASKTVPKQVDTLPQGWIKLPVDQKPQPKSGAAATISMMDQLHAWVKNISEQDVCAYLEYLDRRDREYREANDSIFQEVYIDGWKMYPQNEKYLFYQGMFDDLEEDEDSDSEDSIGGRVINTGIEIYQGSRNYDVN
jgi:hypothetical protein